VSGLHRLEIFLRTAHPRTVQPWVAPIGLEAHSVTRPSGSGRGRPLFDRPQKGRGSSARVGSGFSVFWLSGRIEGGDQGLWGANGRSTMLCCKPRIGQPMGESRRRKTLSVSLQRMSYGPSKTLSVSPSEGEDLFPAVGRTTGPLRLSPPQGRTRGVFPFTGEDLFPAVGRTTGPLRLSPESFRGRPREVFRREEGVCEGCAARHRPSTEGESGLVALFVVVPPVRPASPRRLAPPTRAISPILRGRDPPAAVPSSRGSLRSAPAATDATPLESG